MTQHQEHEGRTLQGFRSFLHRIYNNGSEGSEWHSEFNEWLLRLEAEASAGKLRPEEARKVWHEAASDALTFDTCQGYVCIKPRGYDGDFEIIERIYARWRSPNPAVAKWDDYFHAQAAPQAVWNRKRYFLDWLASWEAASKDELHLLNLGSGPARDIYEHFTAHPASRVCVDCVESDPEAITYAQTLCSAFKGRVQFHHSNVLRFHGKRKYQLGWSGGLFDYLNDDLFVRLLRRIWRNIEPGGEMVVGNFSPANSTRTYMELGRWFLFHRNERQLLDLAVRADVPSTAVRVATEPAGVNLFLHIRA